MTTTILKLTRSVGLSPGGTPAQDHDGGTQRDSGPGMSRTRIIMIILELFGLLPSLPVSPRREAASEPDSVSSAAADSESLPRRPAS